MGIPVVILNGERLDIKKALMIEKLPEIRRMPKISSTLAFQLPKYEKILTKMKLKFRKSYLSGRRIFVKEIGRATIVFLGIKRAGI